MMRRDVDGIDRFYKSLHLGLRYDVMKSAVCCTPQFGSWRTTERVALQHLLRETILSKENPCGLFIDQRVLEENLNEIKSAFPEPYFSHHYAVKANPIKSVLKVVKDNGFGVECASFGEVSTLSYLQRRSSTRCRREWLRAM